MSKKSSICKGKTQEKCIKLKSCKFATGKKRSFCRKLKNATKKSTPKSTPKSTKKSTPKSTKKTTKKTTKKSTPKTRKLSPTNKKDVYKLKFDVNKLDYFDGEVKFNTIPIDIQNKIKDKLIRSINEHFKSFTDYTTAESSIKVNANNVMTITVEGIPKGYMNRERFYDTVGDIFVSDINRDEISSYNLSSARHILNQ